MSEEFKMPEKWCISGSMELSDFQIHVLKDKASCALTFIYYYYILEGNNFLAWHCRNSKPKGYTEITFEQFKYYYYSMQKPVQEIKPESAIEQLREKCKRLELTPLFSGAEFVTLELIECDGEIIHRLKEYRDFDKLCENALIILNLEE